MADSKDHSRIHHDNMMDYLAHLMGQELPPPSSNKPPPPPSNPAPAPSRRRSKKNRRDTEVLDDLKELPDPYDVLPPPSPPKTDESPAPAPDYRSIKENKKHEAARKDKFWEGFHEIDPESKREKQKRKQEKKVGKLGEEAAEQAALAAATGDPIAAVNAAKKMKQLDKEKSRQVGQDARALRDEGLETVKASKATDIGKHASGMLEETGTLMKHLGGGKGAEAIEWIGKFGKGLFEVVGKVKEFGDKLHEENMQFAKFSSSMAIVNAETQVRRIYLEQERGERRAKTAKKVAEANVEFEKEVTAPVEDWWDNIKGELYSTLFKGISDGVKDLKGGAKEPKDSFSEEDTSEMDEKTFREKMRKEYESVRDGRPRRLR